MYRGADVPRSFKLRDMGKIDTKIKKTVSLFKDRGAKGVCDRAYYGSLFKKEPDALVSFELYDRLTSPTPSQVKRWLKEVAELGNGLPVRFHIVMIQGEGEAAEEAAKKSLELQIYPYTSFECAAEDEAGDVLSKAATGSGDDYVLIVRAGDTFRSDYLYRAYRFILRHRDAQIIYTDDVSCETHFKPDFSCEYLCAYNYIGESFFVKAQLPGELRGRFDAYDLLLKSAAAGRRFAHARGLCYTARGDHKSELSQEERTELVRAVYEKRLGLKNISISQENGIVSVRAHAKASISVIIPNKDHVDDLLTCLKSLAMQSIAGDLEVIIAENNSARQETEEFYAKLSDREADAFPKELKNLGSIIVVRVPVNGFNYSFINNYAAKEACGEYLLLLNNDVELKGSDSLEALLGAACARGVGAAGARLLYPDGTVQHAGVVIGMGGAADHIYRGCADNGYLNGVACAREVSAVTAACMMVRRDAFFEAGGFDEGLAVNFNDIDLCIRLREAGWRIVYRPECTGVHYESKSRQPGGGEGYISELNRFRTRHKELLKRSDPFYSPALTYSRGDFSCANPFIFENSEC